MDNCLVVAPMAGVTDRPFRQMCRRLGAGMAVSEMTTSDPSLWHTPKSRSRMNHTGESEPIVVQIAGADPAMLAAAAQHNVEHGAQIIDINMGCPAKKVCNAMAGSALLGDEPLVERILKRVVDAVDVPVTLKIRTGLDPDNKNALTIANMARDNGISALTIHGRTRAEKYGGQAEYRTMARVKETVDIPLIANGDIDGPAKALEVLEMTGADGLMVGRAAQGNPWIFGEILHFARTGTPLPRPSADTMRDTALRHVQALHQFHGEHRGVRIARKHISWYLGAWPGYRQMKSQLMRAVDPAQQLHLLHLAFESTKQAA